MKKNIWMVLAAASLMTACDYNEKYFEGFDETDQSNVQKYTVEYTEKTFKETESAKDVIIPCSPRNIIPVTMVRLLL